MKDVILRPKFHLIHAIGALVFSGISSRNKVEINTIGLSDVS